MVVLRMGLPSGVHWFTQFSVGAQRQTEASPRFVSFSLSGRMRTATVTLS